MKRYALFVYKRNHPLGGWHDFRDSFDDVMDAKIYIASEIGNKDWDWAHIIDLTTGEEVWNLKNE